MPDFYYLWLDISKFSSRCLPGLNQDPQWKEARQHLSELRAKYPLHQGILERIKKLETVEAGTAFVTTEWLSPLDQKKEEKIQKLQFLLSHINSRRNS
jgi:hypothetical protein